MNKEFGKKWIINGKWKKLSVQLEKHKNQGFKPLLISAAQQDFGVLLFVMLPTLFQRIGITVEKVGKG